MEIIPIVIIWIVIFLVKSGMNKEAEKKKAEEKKADATQHMMTQKQENEARQKAVKEQREEERRREIARRREAEQRKKEELRKQEELYRRAMQKKDTILERAKENVAEVERETSADTITSPAVHHHPEDVWEDSALGSIENLMVKGYEGNLCFERDFLGEATDLLNCYTFYEVDENGA